MTSTATRTSRRRRRSGAAVISLCALLTACGGDDDAAGQDGSSVPSTTDAGADDTDPAVTSSIPGTSTTAVVDQLPPPATPPTTTSPATTPPATDAPPPPPPTQPTTTLATTTLATDPTTTPPPTQPPPLDQTLATTFDPVSGTDPAVGITTFVTADPGATGDPDSLSWIAAGGQAGDAQLSGDQFWVQFRIENFDAAGIVTDLTISIDGLASGLCTDAAPIGAVGATTCIAGPFALNPGPQTFDVNAIANGRRQMFGDQLISPPLTRPLFQGAPVSYFVLFDVTPAGGARTGALIQGSTSGDAVVVSGVFDATVLLDCRTPGDGAGFPVVAASIIRFDDGGNEIEGCFDVPVVEPAYEHRGDLTLSFTGT